MEVERRDSEVDQREVEVEEECLKMLALYQPVATDLRLIVAVLKINNDLEQIGDLAVNIARKAAAVAAEPPSDVPFDIAGMWRKGPGDAPRQPRLRWSTRTRSLPRTSTPATTKWTA